MFGNSIDTYCKSVRNFTSIRNLLMKFTHEHKKFCLLHCIRLSQKPFLKSIISEYFYIFCIHLINPFNVSADLRWIFLKIEF